MNDAVLAELQRPNGTALRITREMVAGRDVVRLIHASTTGVTVHSFILELPELQAVTDALREAAPPRPPNGFDELMDELAVEHAGYEAAERARKLAVDERLLDPEWQS
ncbi:MAG TPA: hypothetical protein VF316_21345 [Polyangiaceae bacterium]